MIISHKHKFIFIKTSKTAGTSIEIFLEAFCDESDIITPIYPRTESHRARNFCGFFNPVPELLVSNVRGSARIMLELMSRRRFFNHMSAVKVRARIPPRIWNSYFKFAVERNPWDKTVSHFHMLKHRHRGRLTFDDYIKMKKFCLNYPKYTENMSGEPVVIVDRLIRYERLAEDLGEVLKMVGIPFEGDLGVRAKSDYGRSGAGYRTYFSEANRNLISKTFEPEIKLLNYVF